MARVEDTAANAEICARFCGSCPTMKENSLGELPPNMLFCARGQSEKPEKIAQNGCNCPGCEVFTKYGLEGSYFCSP